MDSDLLFVKEQIGVQERLAVKYAPQPHRAGLHLSTAERFKNLLVRMEAIFNETTPKASNREKINVCLADLESIPSELLSELSINESDIQEMIIEDIITKNSGVISLDKLIVKFFHRQKEVLKRSTLTSRLYRMAEKGMIFNVPGKRGYYSSHEMSENDVQRVFGRPEAYDGEQSFPEKMEEKSLIDDEIVLESVMRRPRRRIRTV